MKKKAILALLTVGSALTAQGAVVLVQDADIPIPTTFDGVYLDIETGLTGTSPFAGADINFFFGGEGISNDADLSVSAPSLQFQRDVGTFLGIAVNSEVGEVIDSSSTFATGFGASGNPNDHLGTGVDQFVDGERGFLGFSLETGTGTVYGYLDVTLTDNTGGTIHGWSYESTGAAITVVPEPYAIGLLFLGMALGLRRRRCA